MMGRISAWTRLLLAWLQLGLLSGAVAAAQVPRLEDFAFGMRLDIQGAGAIYRVDLPESVYQGLTRADLADLRVFNADARLVPHSLAPAPRETASAMRRFELPLFPLYEDSPTDAAAIRLLIEQWDGSRRLRLQQQRRIPGQRLKGYILDARDVDLPLQRFGFSWEQGGFLLRVSLQAGNDLQNWRTLVAAASLADMQHLGHHLLRERIAVQAVEADYYRLLFADPEQAVSLAGAHAWGSHTTHISRFQSTELRLRRGPQAGEYLFDLPPALPVERLRIRLPENNSLASALLSYRHRPNQPWREYRRVTLYRLQHKGVRLEQEDLSLHPPASRQWRLLVDLSGGGLGDGLPRIEALWQPHELRFVARGEAPYTLAWGSAKPMSVAMPGAAEMLRNTGLAPLPASLDGQVRRLADDAVLNTPLDWRRGLLWGVLLGGALLLLWMAWRLFRQMNRPGG